MELYDPDFSTTFMMDYAIADRFGLDAVRDTYRRAFDAWKDDVRYMADMVIVLNQRCWMWYAEYEKGGKERAKEFSELYAELYHRANDYCYGRWEYGTEEAEYYFRMTD